MRIGSRVKLRSTQAATGNYNGSPVTYMVRFGVVTSKTNAGHYVLTSIILVDDTEVHVETIIYESNVETST